MGKLRIAQGRFSEAEESFAEAVEIAEKLGIQYRIGSVKRSRASLAEKQNDQTRAQLLQEAVSIFEKLGSPKAKETLQDVRRVEGKLPEEM
jgi:4-hydroxy-3-methylbut-2-en-1-yl diphosphate synthase IspG/GcpE